MSTDRLTILALILALAAYAMPVWALPPDTNDVQLVFQKPTYVKETLVSFQQSLSRGQDAQGVLLDLSGFDWADHVRVDALFQKDDRLIFSTDVSFEQAGTVYAPADLVAYYPASGLFSNFFDGSSHGLPENANIDAASQAGTLAFYISLDAPCWLTNVGWVGEADLVEFDDPPDEPVYRIDYATLDIPYGANLDALYNDGGDIYFSLDRTVAINSDTGTDHAVWCVTNVSGQLYFEPAYVSNSIDVVSLDVGFDYDGDGLTRFEEMSGYDDPATTFTDTSAPLNPGGYTSSSYHADSDYDGFNDGEEAVAGTNPMNSNDFLWVMGLEQQGVEQVIEWRSVTGRTYQVRLSTDLEEGFPFVLVEDLVATATNTYQTNTVIPDAYFYRVQIDLDE